MKKQIKQLKEFHKSFNLPMRNTPSIIPQKEYNLRHRILREEVFELLIAEKERNIIEVTDAIVDCLYVLLGTAVQFGVADKIEECFDEVHRSNMSKLDKTNKPVMRADGKVMKSDLYSPPDLRKILFKK